MKILIASQNTDWNDELIEYHPDIEFILTTNGFEVVDIYFKSYPDILIINLELDVGSGLESIERICKNGTDPIVYSISQDENEILKQKLLDLGCLNIFSPPLSEEVFTEILSKHQ